MSFRKVIFWLHLVAGLTAAPVLTYAATLARLQQDFPARESITLRQGLASLGGGLLVYTGFALSWCRFFFRKNSAPTEA